MTDDTIKLKPADQILGVLAPGEFAIDEVARELWLDKKGLGPRAIPLDRGPLPPKPRPANPAAVLTLAVDGPAWTVLTGPGGGDPVDNVPGWFVPSGAPITPAQPVNVTGTTRAGAYTTFFDVSEDLLVRRMLVMPAEGNDVNFTFGIADANGVSLVEFSTNANAGTLAQDTFFTLTAGRYHSYVFVETALVFTGCGFAHPWLPAETPTQHIVFLRLN
jgi:hypothetical protein